MRVKDCEKCDYCQRCVWTQKHKPRDYHAIGMSHAYHVCLLEFKRCLDVKKCPKEKEEKNESD